MTYAEAGAHTEFLEIVDCPASFSAVPDSTMAQIQAMQNELEPAFAPMSLGTTMARKAPAMAPRPRTALSAATVCAAARVRRLHDQAPVLARSRKSKAGAHCSASWCVRIPASCSREPHTVPHPHTIYCSHTVGHSVSPRCAPNAPWGVHAPWGARSTSFKLQ